MSRVTGFSFKNLNRTFMLKQFTYVILLVMLLTTLCFSWLVVSESGTRLLFSQLTRLLENEDSKFNIDNVQGTLFSGLRIQQLHYQTNVLELDVTSVSLEIKPTCLLTYNICIEAVDVIQPTVKILQVATSAPEIEQKSAPTLIQSLIPISLNTLSIKNIDVELRHKNDAQSDNSIRIQAMSLDVEGLAFNDSLIIQEIALSDMIILQSQNTPGQSVKQQSPIIDFTAISEWQYQIPELNGLSIPIIMDIKRFKANRINVLQDQIEQASLTNISANAVVNQQQLNIDINQVDWQNWRFSSELRLSPEWAFQLSASGQELTSQAPLVLIADWELNEVLSPMTFEMSGMGDLTNVTVQGRLNSADDLELLALEVEVYTADPLLPIAGRVNGANLSLGRHNDWLQINGELGVKGNLQNYELNTIIEIESSLVGNLAFNSDINFNADDNKRLHVKNISISSDLGELDWQADFHLSEQLLFDSQITIVDVELLDLLQTGLLHEHFIVSKNYQEHLRSARPSAQLNFDGALNSKQQLQFNSNINASAIWLNKPATLATQVNVNTDLFDLGRSQFDVPSFFLKTGDNELQLAGSFNPDQKIKGELLLNITDVSQILPEASGVLASDMQFSGTAFKPDITTSFTAKAFQWQGFTFKQLSFTNVLNWEAPEAFKLEGFATELSVNDQVFNAHLSSTGSAREHNIQVKVQSENVNAQIALEGQLQETQWSGLLVNGRIAEGETLFLIESPAALKLQWAPLSFKSEKQCWKHLEARVCLDSLNYDSSLFSAKISGTELPVEKGFKRLLSGVTKLNTDSLLSFSGNVEWQLPALPNIELVAELSPGKWNFVHQEHGFYLEKSKMKGLLKQGLFQSNIELVSGDSGSINAEVMFELPPSLANLDRAKFSSMSITGQLHIDNLDLQPVVWLLPQFQKSAGLVNANIKARWHDNRPYLNGHLNIIDMFLLTEQQGLNISDFSPVIIFENSEAKISGAFMFGGGRAEMTGSADWLTEPQLQLSIVGNNLRYSEQEFVDINFSPDMHLNLTAEAITIKGELVVPQATIKIEKVPDSALYPSSDILVVTSENDRAVASNGLKKNKAFPVNLDLNLAIDPQRNQTVRLEAFGLDTALSGTLGLAGSAQNRALNGEINLLDGSYRAWGQQLLIQEGELRFSGPVDSPYLYTKAVRDPVYTADNVVAGLLIDGQVRKPAISIFSKPELPQSEALSYLMRGKSLGAKQTQSEQSVFTEMLLNFGLNKSENRISALGNKIGIEDLSIGMSGQGGDATVAVSGSVAPNIKLSYGVGVFSAISEVSLRFQVLPKLYLEAVSGLTNAVDLYYQFDDGKFEKSFHNENFEAEDTPQKDADPQGIDVRKNTDTLN